MNPEQVIEMLGRTGALLEGHFRLTSGLHSDRYFQCALALKDPKDACQLGRALAQPFSDTGVTMVAGPAIGGILIAHEVARSLGVRAIYSERDGGVMTLRRGFAVGRSEKVLIVEDVVTTGGSVCELIDLLRAAGASLVGAGCIVDRRGGKNKLPVHLESLLRLACRTYSAEECPMCRAGSKPIKPGSRQI
jgi:orotate phosphoribosyltransferase